MWEQVNIVHSTDIVTTQSRLKIGKITLYPLCPCVYVPVYMHSYYSVSLFETICMLFYVETNEKNRTEWTTQPIHSPDVQYKVVPMSLGAMPKQTHTNLC